MECSPNPDCKYWEQGCATNTHHLYYPRRNYVGYIQKKFREHSSNKVLMCRADHDDLHATTEPPPKPQTEYMLGYLLLQDLSEEVLTRLQREAGKL